jgi:hypothetical protein
LPFAVAIVLCLCHLLSFAFAIASAFASAFACVIAYTLWFSRLPSAFTLCLCPSSLPFPSPLPFTAAYALSLPLAW